MKIIIPMAGAGSRFRKIGIQKPKHEIIAKGKTLFSWSMLSLIDFFEYEFLFIYRGNKQQENFIRKECKILGITKFRFIQLNTMTAGQASTVMKCDEIIEDEEAIGIYNIDTYIEEYSIKQQDIQTNTSGFIPVFRADGDRWSFIKIDSTGNVTEVSEKVRISDLATVGFYYFNKWDSFRTLYQTHREDIIKQYKETYIAPMYNYLIAKNQGVTYSIIASNKVHVLGTPKDLTTFCPDFLEQNI